MSAVNVVGCYFVSGDGIEPVTDQATCVVTGKAADPGSGCGGYGSGRHCGFSLRSGRAAPAHRQPGSSEYGAQEGAPGTALGRGPGSASGGAFKSGLGVLPSEVVNALRWSLTSDPGVGSVMIVMVQPGVIGFSPGRFTVVGSGVGPFLGQGSVKPFDFPVGLGGDRGE